MSDASIVTLVTGITTVVTTIVAFLTLWVKLQYGVDKVSNKVDDNTRLTKEGTTVAAIAATAAANRTDELAKSLNGALDARIQKVVDMQIKIHIDPLLAAFKEHYEADERNMTEIRATLAQLLKK